MTRNELEQVLADHGYMKKYHGTKSDIWQKEETILELLSDTVFDGVRYIPYEDLSMQNEVYYS